MSSAESEDELVPDSDSSFHFDVVPSSSSSDSESIDEITDGGMHLSNTDTNHSIDTGARVVEAINWRTALSLGTFSYRKEARIQLDTIEKARFKHKHNYQTLESAVTQFYCSSHSECGRKARIIVPKNTSGIFEVVVGGVHGVSAAGQPRTGIDKRFEIECDNLLLGGATPARRLVILNERYVSQPELLELLPDGDQLRNRSCVLKDKGRFDIKTLTEVNLWASPKSTAQEKKVSSDSSWSN